MAVTLARGPAKRTRRVTQSRWGRRRRIQLMEKFFIEGGVPLSGTMTPAGNKNSALPILASAVLTDEEIHVRNVPRIRDVDAMLNILSCLRVDVRRRGPNELALCAARLREGEGEA